MNASRRCLLCRESGQRSCIDEHKIVKLVSPFLKSVVYPSLAGTGYLRRLANPGLAVVTYHGVLPRSYESLDASLDGNLVTAETLRQQIRLLKSRYCLVDPSDVLTWNEGKRDLPPKAVLLTCDDGLLNHLTDMLPVLQQENVKCLFFVTGASAGQERLALWYEELFLIFMNAPGGPFEISCEGITIRGEMGSRDQRRSLWWSSVQHLSHVAESKRQSFLESARQRFRMVKECSDPDSPRGRRFTLLTSDEVGQLAAAGMTIGAHTMSHPILAQLPAELAWDEISECKKKLQSVTRSDVWAFAYPFGDAQSVNPSVLTMPGDAGYRLAFLNYGGGLGVEPAPFAFPRIHVTATMKLPEFEAHVSGFYARMRKRVGRTA